MNLKKNIYTFEKAHKITKMKFNIHVQKVCHGNLPDEAVVHIFLSMTAENMEHSLIRQVTRRLLNVAVAAKKPLKADCNLNTVSR